MELSGSDDNTGTDAMSTTALSSGHDPKKIESFLLKKRNSDDNVKGQSSNDSINPSQIHQLEDVLGLSFVCDTISELSMSSQFSQLARVCAQLAHKVVQFQKEGKHSKAFCEALLKENEKSKKENLNLRQQLENLQKLHSEKPHCSHNDEESKSHNNSELLTRLQSRIKKLESHREEILRVNKQWDSAYRKLKSEFDLCVLNQVSSSSDEADRKRKKDADHLIRNAKKEIRALMKDKSELARNFANAHSQVQTLKRDLAKLKENLKTFETEKSLLESENQRLNLALNAAYSIHNQRSLACNDAGFDRMDNHLEDGNDLQTQIDVLQEQVKIYREDFETERRDREKSQSEKQKLEERLTMSKHDVQALTQQVKNFEMDFKQEKLEKERLKRQIHSARNHRDAIFAPLSPPAYHPANRFQLNGDVNIQRPLPCSTRNLQGGRLDWQDNLDRELVYPPLGGDEH